MFRSFKSASSSSRRQKQRFNNTGQDLEARVVMSAVAVVAGDDAVDDEADCRPIEDSAIWLWSDAQQHAEAVDSEFGFHRTGNEHENWGGRGEKWFRGGEDKTWHFITPDGNIYRWTTPGKAEGKLVATVSPSFHENLTSLTSAADTRLTPAAGVVMELQDGSRFEFTSKSSGRLIAPNGSVVEYSNVKAQWTRVTDGPPFTPIQWAVALREAAELQAEDDSMTRSESPDWLGASDGHVGFVEGKYLAVYTTPAQSGFLEIVGDRVNSAALDVDAKFGFQTTDEVYENWGGKDEKWFRAEDGAWHFVTPDGLIHRWTTPGKAEGRVVASVDPVYHEQLDRLLTAADPMSGSQCFPMPVADNRTLLRDVPRTVSSENEYSTATDDLDSLFEDLAETMYA